MTTASRIPVLREWIGAPAGTLTNPTVGLLLAALAIFGALAQSPKAASTGASL